MIHNSNPLNIINVSNHKVRSVSIHNKELGCDELWFVLADVLEAMGSKTNTTEAAKSIRAGLNDSFIRLHPVEVQPNNIQDVNIVSFMAAAFLASRSNTPEGNQLNLFIFGEVLPCIIAHKAYIPNMTERDVEYLRAREGVEAIKSLSTLTQLQFNNVIREAHQNSLPVRQLVDSTKYQAAGRAVCWKELKKRRGFTKDSQVFESLLAVGVIRHSEYAQGYDLTPLGHEYAVNLGEPHNPITGVCWDPLLLDAIREQS